MTQYLWWLGDLTDRRSFVNPVTIKAEVVTAQNSPVRDLKPLVFEHTCVVTMATLPSAKRISTFVGLMSVQFSDDEVSVVSINNE